MTTQADQQTYLLLLNSAPAAQHIVADVSSLARRGEVTLWELSDQIYDQVVERKSIDNGVVQMEMPAQSARLVVISSEE